MLCGVGVCVCVCVCVLYHRNFLISHKLLLSAVIPFIITIFQPHLDRNNDEDAIRTILALDLGSI
jgi:hypothetical protein